MARVMVKAERYLSIPLWKQEFTTFVRPKKHYVGQSPYGCRMGRQDNEVLESLFSIIRNTRSQAHRQKISA